MVFRLWAESTCLPLTDCFSSTFHERIWTISYWYWATGPLKKANSQQIPEWLRRRRWKGLEIGFWQFKKFYIHITHLTDDGPCYLNWIHFSVQVSITNTETNMHTDTRMLLHNLHIWCTYNWINCLMMKKIHWRNLYFPVLMYSPFLITCNSLYNIGR